MIYNPFTDLAMFLFMISVVIIGYKFLKPYIRVEAYKAGYYVGRLRQHADKKKVNLDKEVGNILRSDSGLLKQLNPDVGVKTYVEATDNLFDEKKK